MFYLIVATSLLASSSSNLDSPGVETLQNAIERLSSQMDEPVRASSELRSALVYIAHNGASPRTCIDALSRALHASVVKEADGLRIQRTATDVRALEKDFASVRSKWITKRIDALTESRTNRLRGRTLNDVIVEDVDRYARYVEARSRGEEASAPPFFPSEMFPSEDLLISALRSVGYDRIAAVPVGRVKVWENKPVYGASELPNLDGAVAKYLSQVTEMRGRPLPSVTVARIASLGMESTFSSLASEPQAPARLRLEVRPEIGRTVISLAGYDVKGDQTLTAYMIAMPTQTWQSPAETAREEAKAIFPSFLPLSEEAAQAATARADQVISSRPIWFTDPVQREPMDLFVAPALLEVSKLRADRCFVAQVDDILWVPATQSMSGDKLNVPLFRSLIPLLADYEVVDGDSYTVMRPLSSLRVRDGQANRLAIKAFVSEVLRVGRIDIKTFANFRNRIGPRTTPISNRWEALLVGQSPLPKFSGGTSNVFYRLIGAVADIDWERGGSLAVRSADELGLTPRLRDLIEEDRTPTDSATRTPDVYKHLPELYPDGSISKTPIRIERAREDLVGTSLIQGGVGVQWATAISSPASDFTREEYEEWLGKTFLFQTGFRSNITVTIGFPGGRYSSVSFAGPVEVAIQPTTYQSLPAQVKDRLWRQASGK